MEAVAENFPLPDSKGRIFIQRGFDFFGPRERVEKEIGLGLDFGCGKGSEGLFDLWNLKQRQAEGEKIAGRRVAGRDFSS